MKIVSCSNCATLFNGDILPFSHESRMRKDDGTIDEDRFTYHNNEWVAFVTCPVCQENIEQE